MGKKEQQKSIAIYSSSKGVDVQVRVDKESVWLDTHKMAEVFGVDRTGVVRHINNVYKTKELERESTCAKIAQVAKDGKIRQMDMYNLDMIISVGYRVNSKQATAFRVWATSVLKKYLIDGYAINERRIQEAQQKFADLQSVVQFLSTKSTTTRLLH